MGRRATLINDGRLNVPLSCLQKIQGLFRTPRTFSIQGLFVIAQQSFHNYKDKRSYLLYIQSATVQPIVQCCFITRSKEIQLTDLAGAVSFPGESGDGTGHQTASGYFGPKNASTSAGYYKCVNHRQIPGPSTAWKFHEKNPGLCRVRAWEPSRLRSCSY